MMDETYQEINEAGKCVIEIEDYNGNGRAYYLIDLKEKEIVKKDIWVESKEYDLVKEINSNDIETIVNSIPNFDVADIDGDYRWDTEYHLIRLQENEITKSTIQR